MDRNFISEIIKKLKIKGCDQSDVFFIESSSLSSTRRLKKLEMNEHSQNSEIGIRAIIGKKQSIISTSEIDKKNIDTLIDKVVDMANAVPENEYCGLADNSDVSSFDIEKFNALDLNDPKIPTLDELDDKAKSLENSALENKEIINSEGAEVAWSRTKYLLAGSNGLFQEFSKTNSSFILAVLAGNKSCMEREYEYKSKIYLEELGDFEKIGKLTADRAIKRLNAKKIKTCKTNVIFDARVSPSLINSLASASNASLICRGTSYLKDKLGKKIFNDNINIIDDPLMVRQLKSKILDCEGTKCTKKNLVESGSLKFFFNSLDYSKQLKHGLTGHSTRSVSSLPSPSPSNLYMENGSISKTSMIKSLKNGFLVTELMGSSINMTNGDYSRGASGFWIENGEIAFPISEVTIADNLLNIFEKIVPANDLEFNFGTNAPSCLVENMTVAGI